MLIAAGIRHGFPIYEAMELTRRSRCFHFGVRNYEATRLDLGTESVVAIFASIAGLNNYTLSIYN